MSLNSFMQTTFIVRWQSPTGNKQQRRDRKLFILFCTVCRCVFTWHRQRLSRRLQENRVSVAGNEGAGEEKVCFELGRTRKHVPRSPG